MILLLNQLVFRLFSQTTLLLCNRVGVLNHHGFELNEIEPNHIIEDTVQLLWQTEHIALRLKH